jgi:hypothetical protein
MRLKIKYLILLIILFISECNAECDYCNLKSFIIENHEMAKKKKENLFQPDRQNIFPLNIYYQGYVDAYDNIVDFMNEQSGIE